MFKKSLFRKIIIYLFISIAGSISGYTISLNGSILLNNDSANSNITSENKEVQSGKSASIEECLKKKVRKTANNYGFDGLNKNNWNDFVLEVKKQHLDSFEKSMGVNYFQLITLSGDITRADRYYSMSMADINQTDITGMNPIAYAARYLDVNAVKALHGYGADLLSPVVYIPKHIQGLRIYGSVTYPPETPLKMAILQNDPVNTPAIIRYFLDNGVNFTNGNDYILSSLSNIEVMEEFIIEILDNTDLQKSAIPSSPNTKTNAVSKIFQFDKTGLAVNYLLEKGLSPEIHEDNYFPVLNASILNSYNSPEIIIRLINEGFDVNKSNISSRNDRKIEWLTPTYYALIMKDPEILEILLKNGATISKKGLEKVNKFPEDEKEKFLNLFRKYDGG